MTRPVPAAAPASPPPDAAPPPVPATATARGAPRRIAARLLRALALPVVLIGAWWWASAASGNYYLPTPGVIATTFGEVWFSERFLDDALPSIARLLAGYGIALVLGVALGMLLGGSPRLRALTEPVLEFLRAVPPPVLVPLLILLAGVDNTMKLLVIVSGCVWPVLLNTVEGVRAVDPVLSDTCRAYRIRGGTRLRVLVLCSAGPQIAAGARQALSIAIILMVISEMFASSSGLGYTVLQFQRGFAVPEMWSGIVLLGLIGVALSLLFRLVERYTLGWYTGLRAASRGE